VTVVTRGLTDGHVIYALCIVPGKGYDSMARTFTQMLRTLTVNDDATHRGTQTSSRLDRSSRRASRIDEARWRRADVDLLWPTARD
jgi:hypothetical protein